MGCGRGEARNEMAKAPAVKAIYIGHDRSKCPVLSKIAAGSSGQTNIIGVIAVRVQPSDLE